MKAALTWMSVFTAAAGVWLAVMENILKHAGYAGTNGDCDVYRDPGPRYGASSSA